MAIKQKTESKEQGFTIVELLATLIIGALYITVFFQLYGLVDRVSTDSYRLAASNQIVYEKLQEYENREFDSISILNGETPTEIEDFTSTLPSDLPDPVEAKVISAQITPTLKAVTVRATYGASGEGQRIIEYVSYIQESGLGR